MIRYLVDLILYVMLNLDKSLHWVESLDYFIYDSIKIVILLFVMIAVMGYIRTYISREKLKAILSKQKFGVGNFAAAGFGALTPFCSCSSIPIFLGFIEAGVPLGITFSFLVTSPIVNEYLVILMLGYFGWKVTILYVLFGILVGAFTGMIIEKLRLEKYLVKDLITKTNKNEVYKNQKQRFNFGIKEATSILKKLWYWLLIGVGLGAIIHNYVPQDLIYSISSSLGIFAVPLATLIGVPMYGGSAAILPIAAALFQNGLPLGTALAFLMAISAISLPEAIILRRAMKIQLIGIFFGIVTIAIIAVGFIFNFLT